jgi:hypothetical protein
MLQAANQHCRAELGAEIDTNSHQPHGQKVSYDNCLDEMCGDAHENVKRRRRRPDRGIV